MKFGELVCVGLLVVYTTGVSGQDLSVSDAMAARVDAQAWRVDRLTKQFQAISDKAVAARAASKAAGDTARHLMNTHMSDDECRPNTRRCGKSAQCISVMAFCDGVNDCKNHYDENPERCESPFQVNSTWLHVPVYDNCWNGGDTLEYELVITSASPSNVYKVREVMVAECVNVVMRGGLRQVIAFHVDVSYCKGSQRLIVSPAYNQSFFVIGQFDGVYNDRFVSRIYHVNSGSECGVYRAFKQQKGARISQ